MTLRLAQITFLSVVALAAGGCSDEEPTGVLVPANDMVAAGTPGNGDGWDSVGSTETRPALSLYDGGLPMLVLTCKGVITEVQARGFEPKQAWPQPDLVIRFGNTTRTGSPDVRNIGNQVAYEIGFPIADDVLDALQSSAPIVAEFNGESRPTLPIPDDQARTFVERCASLVPAGMRQSNRLPG